MAGRTVTSGGASGDASGVERAGVERAGVRAQLDELLGGRTDRETALVARLVAGFRPKAAGLLGLADEAAAAGDVAAAARHLHTLAGAAALLGAVELPRVCQELQASAAATAAGRDRRDRLEPAIDRFCAVLDDQARQLPGGS